MDVEQLAPGDLSAVPVAGVSLLLCCFSLVVFLGVTVALVTFVSRRHRARREHLRQWTAQYGWTINESPSVDWGARLPGGNTGGVSRTICGTFGGRPVCVGDYSHVDHYQNNDGTRSPVRVGYVVVVVRLPTPYPTVAVQPRGALSKLARALTGDGGTGIGAADFDRRFRIVADDPLAAQRLLVPALVAAHLAGEVPPWSILQNELMTYYPGNIDRPEQIPGLAAPLVRVADLLGR